MRSYLIGIGLAAAVVLSCGKDGDSSDPPGEPANNARQNAKAPRQEPKGPPSEPPAGPTGSIKGTVKFSGTAPDMPKLRTGSDPVCARTEKFAETVVANDNGTLRDVVVRVKPGTVPGWQPKDIVKVNQQDCVYKPRVQTAVLGQQIEVSNSDETMHNVHLRQMKLSKRQAHRTIFNRAQPAGAKPITAMIGGAEVVKLKCDAHAWMQAYVVMSDQPYASVSTEDGSFEIKAVPAGKLELQAWHQYYGLKTAEVTVEEGATAEVEFSFDAKADAPPGG